MLGELVGPDAILAALSEADPGGAWCPHVHMSACGDPRTEIPVGREQGVWTAKRGPLLKWTRCFVERLVTEAAHAAYPLTADPDHPDEEAPMLRSRGRIEHFAKQTCPRALDALQREAGQTSCPVKVAGKDWTVKPAALRPWLRGRAVAAVTDIAEAYDPRRHRQPAVAPNEIHLFNCLRRQLAQTG